MIEVNNLTAQQVDKDFLKKIAKKVLEGEKRKDVDLSIALVGEKRIKELNKKYRKKNRITDVLSFYYRAKRGEEENELLFAYDNSGEIVICLKEVKKGVKKFKSDYKKELARVLIHGILHILGYNHKTMEKKEKNYFKLCQKLI